MTGDQIVILDSFDGFWPQPASDRDRDEYDNLVDAIMLTVRAHWNSGGQLHDAAYIKQRTVLAAMLRNRERK